MLRVLSKIGKVRRYFSTNFQKPTSGLFELLRQYEHDKSLIHSNSFLALEKAYEFSELVMLKMEESTELSEKLESSNGPVNATLIKTYFNFRKQYGFNETFLAHILKLMVKQNERGLDFVKIGQDLYGQYLLKSPLFEYILDDIKLLTNDSIEVDLDSFRSIIKSLTQLEYKDNDLIQNIFVKLLKMTNVHNVELAGEDHGQNDYIVKPSLKNYTNILTKESFLDALEKIIKIKNDPGSVKKSYQEIKSYNPEAEEVNFDSLLERLEKLIKNFAGINLDFFHTISSIRNYYFDLKSEDKMKFIKENPNLYLDFLRLEKKLIICGFLMPKDLLDHKNKSPRDLEVIIENFLLKHNVDPDLIAKLISTANANNKSPQIDHNPLIEDSKITNFVKENVYSGILGCMDELFNMSFAKFSAINPEKNYKYPSFKRAFGDTGNVFQDLINQTGPALDQDLMDFNPIVCPEKSVIGHFGYTTIYQNLCQNFDEMLQKFRSDDSPDAVKLENFNIHLLLQTYIISRKARFGDESNQIEEMIIKKLDRGFICSENTIELISENLEFVSDKIFKNYFKSPEVKNIFQNYMKNQIESKENDLSKKISVIFTGIAVSRIIKNDQYVTNLLSLVFVLLSKENMKQIYNSRLKREIPLPSWYIKYLFVFDFAKNGISPEEKETSILFEKAMAKITSYLNIDFENKLNEDPAYHMMYQTLFNLPINDNTFTAQNLLAMRLILPLFPVFILKGQKSAVFLLKSEQHCDSVMTTFHKLFFRRQFGKIDVSFVNIRDFFARENYQKELNFDFKENVVEFIKSLVEIKNSETSFGYFYNLFLSAIETNDHDSKSYHDFASNLTILLQKIKSANDDLIIQKNTQKNVEHFGLFHFYVCYAEKVLKEKFPEKSPNKLLGLKIEIEKTINLFLEKNDILKTSDFQLKNKHFGLEGYNLSDENKPSDIEERPSSKFKISEISEFLNLKVFSLSSYFLIESWRENILKNSSIIQFFETKRTFFNKFSNLKKVILPNTSGRKLKRPEFQLFWEDIVKPSTEFARENAIKYESLARINEDADLTSELKWQISLLNFLYEFRAHKDIASMLLAFVSLPFWQNLFITHETLHQIPNELNKEDNLLNFETSEYSYFFDPKTPVKKEESEYKKLMMSKAELRQKIDELRDEIEVQIPKLFKEANSEKSRARLYDGYFKKKQEYHQLLKKYEKEINPMVSMYDGEYYKDLIFKIEIKKKNETEDKILNENNNENAILTNNEQIRSFGEYLSLDFVAKFKVKLGMKTSNEENKFIDELSKNQIIDFIDSKYPFQSFLAKKQIKEVFSEKDFKFFEEHFPSSNIRDFSQNSISDFLCVFALLIDHNNLKKIQNEAIVSNFMKMYQFPVKNFTEQSLHETLNFHPKNSIRFYVNYLERRKWRDSLKISDTDLEILKDMLTILRCFIKS